MADIENQTKSHVEDVSLINCTSQEISSLGEFIFKRVLKINSDRKSAFLLGSLAGKEGDAILTLEKKAFSETDLNEKGYFSDENKLEQHFHNDIYYNFDCFLKPSVNGVKASIIYPATEKHILKFSHKTCHLILETPELYESVTKSYIEHEQFDLGWLHNILNGTKEADRVVYNDSEFILLPDLKWDGTSLETLYLCGITRKKILSIRELRQEHLPLLKHVKLHGEKAIKDRYGVDSSQLRVYLHYQPSFYHLHFHFTALAYDAPGIRIEKSHLLDTVINNIEMLGDYYQRATLPCVLGEGDTLYRLIREAQVK